MAKIIYTARYLDGKESKSDRNYLASSIDYNATREGAEIITLEKTLQYNAERPGVNVINDDGVSHGLFNEKGKCNLEKEKEDMINAYENGSIVWKSIISLHKSDAVEKNLDSWEGWKDLVSVHAPRIAEIYKISLDNFRWNAGFHTNTDNPHIHLTFYSTDPTEGRLSSRYTIESFRKIKSSLVNDLFKEELEELKLDKTRLRNELRDILKNVDYFSLPNNNYLKDLVYKTIDILPNDGRKFYAYMSPEVKDNINKILKIIVTENLDIKNEVDSIISNQKEFLELYNNNPKVIEEKLNDYENNLFCPGKDDSKVLHNSILNNLYKLKQMEDLENDPPISISNIKYTSTIEVEEITFISEQEYSVPNNDSNYTHFCVSATTSLLRVFSKMPRNKQQSKNNDVIKTRKKKSILEM